MIDGYGMVAIVGLIILFGMILFARMEIGSEFAPDTFVSKCEGCSEKKKAERRRKR